MVGAYLRPMELAISIKAECPIDMVSYIHPLPCAGFAIRKSRLSSMDQTQARLCHNPQLHAVCTFSSWVTMVIL